MRHLQIEDLKKFGSVPFELSAVAVDYPEYSDIRFRLADLVASGDVIRIKNGLFVLAPQHATTRLTSGVVANLLYGPSAVSFETALSLYGVIPERVYLTMSAVTKRGKSFRTPVGDFAYYQVDDGVAAVGVRIEETNGGNFLMTTPTRALCDVLMRKPNLRVTSPKALRDYLEEDLRCDLDSLGEPDREVLDAFATCGRKPGLFDALRRMFT